MVHSILSFYKSMYFIVYLRTKIWFVDVHGGPSGDEATGRSQNFLLIEF